ncbi:unnamed protein product [Trichobilharzia regenti]|nr:unnamed protein product [Trichobilharzia regenti]
MNETQQQQQPTFSSTDTIFGYDDETMRRFAEADAVHEAYRLSRQKQRRSNYSSRRHNYNSESNLILNDHHNDIINEKNKTDQSFNFTDEQLLNFDFEMKTCGETDYSETTMQFNEDAVEFGSAGDEMDDDDDDEEIDEDDDDDDEGVPTSIIP